MGIVSDTINRGMDYINRLVFPVGSDKLAVKDYPGIPLWVKIRETGLIINSGEAKGGAVRIYPFGKVYRMFSTRLIQNGCTQIQGDGYSDVEITEYDFDDGEFALPSRVSVRLRIHLQSKCDGQTMRAKLEMVSYNSPKTIEVWWGNQAVWLGNNVGQSVVFEKAFGWQSCRYVGRHHTRMTARLFDEMGETEKAQKLHTFMNDCGFTKDVYDPYFNASNSYDDGFLTTREIYPDPDTFDNYPWGEGFTPYRSVLESWIVRDAYVAYDPYNIIPPRMWRGIVPLNITSSPFYDCTMAMHLLNKYGAGKAAEAKNWLERAGFNGYGTRREVYFSYPDLITRISIKKVMTRGAHEGYSLPCFVAAATKLYQLTGDVTARDWARGAAAVLRRLQWWHPNYQWKDILRYRPDHYGGFKGSYLIGSGPQFTTMDKWFTDIRDYYTKEIIPLHHRSYPDYVGFTPTSGECSILAVMALRRYRDVFGEIVPDIGSQLPKCPTWHGLPGEID